ncbi:MAG: hypothetical protein ACETVZ_00105 [Phycisphaerae bacterium]
MNTFPSIGRKPAQAGFTDEKDPEAVLVASTASGYPLINKLFTFDPRTFSFELHAVVETDKLKIMTFYENNKDVPFYWTNKQDDVEYEVAFVSKPKCRLDGRVDLWRIGLELRQTTP